MSQGNVEVVRSIYEDVLAEGRPSDSATRARIQALFDPDVEVQQMGGVTGTAGTFRGYDGLAGATRELIAVFADFHIVAEQYFEAGDSVVTAARGRGRGRGSGLDAGHAGWPPVGN